MNAIEINYYATIDKYISNHLSGIFFIENNTMPIYVSYPSSYVFNIGKHWACVYIDKLRYGEYFDSFGQPPPQSICDFLDENCISWKHNKKRVQSFDSIYCGHYCLMYLRWCFQNKDRSDF